MSEFDPGTLEYLNALQPCPPWFQGMGATPLFPDPRDWQAKDDPRVRAMLPKSPDSYSLLPYLTGAAYNQESTGACVAASSCGVCSIDTQQFQNAWHTFNWMQLYKEAGGIQSNGVDSRLVLSICQKQGTPLAQGGREMVIESYDFITQSPGAFRSEVKACIALGYPVTLALLLPSDFGWQSGQPSAGVTQGYHQVCACGYDPTYVVILNSWGSGWPAGNSPKGGVGSIRWDYLEASNLQNRYCYAYRTTAKGSTPIPDPGPGPDPTPPPVKTRTVTGVAQGVGVQTLQRGTLLQASAPGYNGTISLLNVTDDAGPSPGPDPTPEPPIPTPDPTPGAIRVMITAKPSQYRNTVSVLAYTSGPSGESLPANVSGSVSGPNGTVILPGQMTHGTQGPATWSVARQAPWGVPCNVTVNASAGSMTGTSTVVG